MSFVISIHIHFMKVKSVEMRRLGSREKEQPVLGTEIDSAVRSFSFNIQIVFNIMIFINS